MTRGLRINLIPPEIQKKRKAEKGILVLLGIVIVYVVFLFVISFFVGVQASNEKAKLEKIKAETALIDREIAKYNIFKDRKVTVAKHQEAIIKAIENQHFWHKLLNEISMIIPTNVSISQLTLSNDTVTMNAEAYSHQDVAEFLVRINDLDELKDPWIDGSKDSTLESTSVLGQSESSSAASSVLGVKFTLTAKLRNPAPTTGQPGTTPPATTPTPPTPQSSTSESGSQ